MDKPTTETPDPDNGMYERDLHTAMRKIEKYMNLGEFIDFRGKLRRIIRKPMRHDDRGKIAIKKTENIDMCVAYIAMKEDCTQVRAKQSIISLGKSELSIIENRDIDSDIVDEFKKVYPYNLFSDNPAIKSMVTMIESGKVVNLPDFKSEELWMWKEDAGYLNKFSDKYGINSSSLCCNVFYLAMDNLLENHEDYSYLKIPKTIIAIEESRLIAAKINGFRASFLKIVHL